MGEMFAAFRTLMHLCLCFGAMIASALIMVGWYMPSQRMVAVAAFVAFAGAQVYLADGEIKELKKRLK